VCMCGFGNVSVCLGSVMCVCVYVCVLFGFCNMGVSVCVGFVICGCVYVWVL